MSKSTRSGRKSKPAKPEKPYPDFPLFAHATKRWAKKIRGKMHYFGSWADGWEAALNSYQEQKDDLHAGRKPRGKAEGLTVEELCNRFVHSKKQRLESGELSARTFAEYHKTAINLAATFGKPRLVEDLRPEDFEKLRAKVAKRWGPVRLANEVGRVRSVFKFGFEDGLMDKPMRFGQGFTKPSKKTMRLHRASGGPCMFEAGEIRQLLEHAGTQLRAMILLGINAGFGNNDCGTLPMKALDLDGGWVNFPRPKTGVDRRCQLWPETIEALRSALAARLEAKKQEHADLVFVTKYGASWVKQMEIIEGEVAKNIDNPVSKELGKLLRKLHINGRRRLGFYSMRHTFATIGGDSRDQVAVNHIMGHSDGSMAATYRERIEDDRLRAVAAHVRGWLLMGHDEHVREWVLRS